MEESKVCDREVLERELVQFVSANTENCPQRSADWYRVRRFSFGGSELANLMGLSKKSYISQSEFFKEKFQATSGTGRCIKQQQQMIMDWGTLFEPVHRMALEHLLGCQINEASMCRGKGILLGCHQSPDGLAVVNSERFVQNIYTGDIVDRSVFDKPLLTVLFEQKSPYLRKIVPRTVPDYYIGQIKLGLSMFKPCDIAIYSESLFRICTYRQWNTATYNTHILVQRKPAEPDPSPLYIGMCVFDELGKAAMGIDQGDLSGIMSQAHFQKMMDLIRANNVNLTTHVFPFADIETAKEKVKQLAKENKAYFCWKLVGMDHTAVERSQGFENLVAMYVNLGSKALTRFSEQGIAPDQLLSHIQEFTSHVKQLGVPLVPGNRQDAWYLRYERQLIDLYQKYLLDDWQSFFVLLTLLSRSKDADLRQRAGVFADKARAACLDDALKNELLAQLLSEVGIQASPQSLPEVQDEHMNTADQTSSVPCIPAQESD